MKLFRETAISFHAAKNLKICVISDIHFSYRVKDQKLNALVKILKSRHPDYIFLPGDLIDSNNMVTEKAEETRLLNFLKNLGKICPVLISKGNHDVYQKASKTHRKKTGDRWEVFENKPLETKIRTLKNLHYLDNEKFEDKNLYVLGLTQTPEYYNFFNKQKTVSIFHPVKENATEFVNQLDQLNKNFLKNLPKGKLKFALIHSPVCLEHEKIAKQLSEFDFFISGHMHNGIVPPLFDELWQSDRGLVSPTRNLFAKNTRQSQRPLKHKSVIAGAVTTWHECTGPAHNLNALYPTHFTTLNFIKETSDLKNPIESKAKEVSVLKDPTEPKIKKSYHKFPK